MYQRLQCTDNYIFKIKLVLFLYLLLSVSWKENNLSWYISVIRQTVRYWTPVFTQLFSWCLHITITYNLLHLRLWYVDVVTVIAQTPEVVCLTFQTSWHEKDGMWSELTWFETTVLHPTTDIFIYLLIILPLGGHIDIQIETKLAVLLGPYIQ